MVYLDNMLVIGKTFDNHLQNLRQVFLRLRGAGLCLKPKKCRLAMRSVEYLGYIMSSEGISPDQTKVTSVPVPTDLKSLRYFVGLASYYRRFIPSFSRIAAPLFELTKKDVPFKLSKECQSAVEKLKETLTNAPVLAFPRFDTGFQLETDASGLSCTDTNTARWDNSTSHLC